MEKASKQNNFHYNKNLKGLAKDNRRVMTKSAACMWKYILGNRQMKGYQFRIERPILNYIVDFVGFDLMLVIEVDGLTHETEEACEKDKERDVKLEQIGFAVLRFSSWEVLNRIVDVAILIGEWIEVNAKIPPPDPRHRGRNKPG